MKDLEVKKVQSGRNLRWNPLSGENLPNCDLKLLVETIVEAISRNSRKYWEKTDTFTCIHTKTILHSKTTTSKQTSKQNKKA